ncbi:hypothetical protein HHI36_021681 [Cryptolaemus montrouzieri]|uniref:Uncharacterized protein n=1 Tax=Cryptolaemus montrouzieri TaxID=559131 RepID=A0ABD2MXG8_9CUCU
MDFSYIEATQTSELTEPEDKSFVNEFIDAKGKIWERNNFLDTYDVNNSGRTNTAFKFDLPKFESGPTEECLSVKREIDSKQFIDKEIKISDEEVFIKYEHYVDVKTDNDGNRAIISEIEVDLFEEDNKTMVHKLIDRESWHEEPTLENSVKLEEVNKETSEVELNSSKLQSKDANQNFVVLRHFETINVVTVITKLIGKVNLKII